MEPEVLVHILVQRFCLSLKSDLIISRNEVPELISKRTLAVSYTLLTRKLGGGGGRGARRKPGVPSKAVIPGLRALGQTQPRTPQTQSSRDLAAS